MNIDNILFPNINKLLNDNGNLSALIIDQELDPIDCIFNNDGGVEINTKDLSYISLSRCNLITMLELIDKAEEKYKQLNKLK